MTTTCAPQSIIGHSCTECGEVFTGTYGEMSREMLAHCNAPAAPRELTCLKPINIPTLPDGSVDFSVPTPMCGAPATHYIPTGGLLPPELSTVWCTECATADGPYALWTVLPPEVL